MDKPPLPEEIRQELEKILDAPLFRGAKRASAFLRYIVEETLAGREHQLKEYTVGLEVFEKGKDFQPHTDPSVRIEAGRLRKRLEHYYQDSAVDGIEILIPKGCYIPQFRRRRQSLHGEPERPLSSPSISINSFESLSSKEPALIAELLFQEMKKAVGNSSDFTLIASGDSAADFQMSGKIYRRRGSFIFYCDLLRTDSGEIVWTEGFPLKSPGRFPLRMAETLAAEVSAVVTGRGGILYDLLGKKIQEDGEIPDSITGIRILFALHKKLMEPGIAGRLRTALERMIITSESRGDLRAFLSQTYWDFCMDLDWNAMVNHDESFVYYRDKALRLSKEAQELDPGGEDSLICGIRCAFHEEDRETLQALTERLFRSNEVSALTMATGALLYSLGGGWETGMTVLENTLPLIPSPPGWFHHLTCQYHLRQMDYEIVLEKAGCFSQADVLWQYVYSATACGLLGHIIEGRGYWEELIRQCPAICEGIHLFLNNYVKEPELVELILSGLEAVGLDRNRIKKYPSGISGADG